MNDYLAREERLHPLLADIDRKKFTYQVLYGPRHFAQSLLEAKTNLEEEAKTAKVTGRLYQVISNQWARVNIADWVASALPLAHLATLFYESCKEAGGDSIEPPPHHSARYKALYNPHYRLVSTDLLPLAVKQMVLEKTIKGLPEGSIIALDGEAGSGKTTLAMLVDIPNLIILHTDDFFPNPLHPEYNDGSSVLALRSISEVLHSFKNGTLSSYQAYDCHTARFHLVTVPPATRLLFEGSYALSFAFSKETTSTVWLSSSAKHLEKVRQSRGKEWLQKFKETWGPNEALYRERERPILRADLIL